MPETCKLLKLPMQYSTCRSLNVPGRLGLSMAHKLPTPYASIGANVPTQFDLSTNFNVPRLLNLSAPSHKVQGWTATAVGLSYKMWRSSRLKTMHWRLSLSRMTSTQFWNMSLDIPNGNNRCWRVSMSLEVAGKIASIVIVYKYLLAYILCAFRE